jgi:hypothetical protein
MITDAHTCVDETFDVQPREPPTITYNETFTTQPYNHEHLAVLSVGITATIGALGIATYDPVLASTGVTTGTLGITDALNNLRRNARKNCYNNDSNTILIAHDTSARERLAVVHEYTHAASPDPLFYTPFAAVSEGLATVAQKELALQRLHTENDQGLARAALKEYADTLAHGLARLYDACNTESLPRLKHAQLSSDEIDAYELGTSMLSLLELRHGPSVYRDILNGDHTVEQYSNCY